MYIKYGSAFWFMSDELIITVMVAAFGVAGIAGFSAVILYLKQLEKSDRREPMSWRCAAFDASAVAPRIRRVRGDYLCEMHLRARPAFHSRGLLDAARLGIQGRAYFCGDEEDAGNDE